MTKMHNFTKLASGILLLSALILTLAGCKSDDASSGGTGTGPIGPEPPRPTFGRPDQNSFSLSVTTKNVEAWRLDGNTTNVTVRLAGQLNDKTVYDGIQVFFSTEGGRIADNCTIKDGDCTVVWNGQNPRPLNGRSSIVAWTEGFESFRDINANGLFDNGDTFNSFGFGVDLNHDMPEPFQDDNENGVRDIDLVDPNNSEEFRDFNGNNSYDLADGLYNGPACADTTGRCSPTQSLFIFDQAIITMSDGAINFEFNNCAGGPLATPVNLVSKFASAVCVRMYDRNNNPPPFGTTIELKGTASSENMTGASVLSTNEVGGVNLLVLITGEESGEGKTFYVKTTSPAGIISSSTAIDIQDSPEPP